MAKSVTFLHLPPYVVPTIIVSMVNVYFFLFCWFDDSLYRSVTLLAIFICSFLAICIVIDR